MFTMYLQNQFCQPRNGRAIRKSSWDNREMFSTATAQASPLDRIFLFSFRLWGVPYTMRSKTHLLCVSKDRKLDCFSFCGQLWLSVKFGLFLCEAECVKGQPLCVTEAHNLKWWFRDFRSRFQSQFVLGSPWFNSSTTVVTVNVNCKSSTSFVFFIYICSIWKP